MRGILHHQQPSKYTDDIPSSLLMTFHVLRLNAEIPLHRENNSVIIFETSQMLNLKKKQEILVHCFRGQLFLVDRTTSMFKSIWVKVVPQRNFLDQTFYYSQEEWQCTLSSWIRLFFNLKAMESTLENWNSFIVISKFNSWLYCVINEVRFVFILRHWDMKKSTRL